MNFVFEDKDNYLNYTACPDLVMSGSKRFAPSPMAITVLHRTQMAKRYSVDDKPNPYIIATGVNHSPNDWVGSSSAFGNLNKSPFESLHKKLLKDVQSGKAMLLFDQSLEGYQTTWLWEYFHIECENYNINPQAIVYTSGNLLGASQYEEWANANNKLDRINVIPYSHFEFDMHERGAEAGIDLSVDKHLSYKKEHDIKSYNCLQKRLRNHRIWFYVKLLEADLLKDGLISMNKFSTNAYMEGKTISTELADRANAILPSLVYGKSNTEHNDSFYINRINDDVCLDSWVSVISEASAADSNGQLFLSEKIFKPIVCYHPFIILGDKDSLKSLREMGYKTFDGFIDERYDTLPTWERYDAIIEELKRIIAIKDKASWFEGMRPILEHNYKNLKNNSAQVNPAFVKLERAYKKYFKLGKYKDASRYSS